MLPYPELSMSFLDAAAGSTSEKRIQNKLYTYKFAFSQRKKHLKETLILKEFREITEVGSGVDTM